MCGGCCVLQRVVVPVCVVLFVSYFSICGASNFPFKIPAKKCFKIFFFALASRSGFGAAFSDAIARSSFVFHNSMSADGIVVAASRLLVGRALCKLCSTK